MAAEEAPGGRQRSRSGLAIGIVATSVVVALAGAFAIGRFTASSDRVAAPTSVASPTVVAQVQAERIPVVESASAPSGVPVAFTAAPDLPDDSAPAAGYVVDDADLDRRSLAAVIARVFGVRGGPRLTDDGVVSIESASRALVEVSPDPQVSWRFDSGVRASRGPAPADARDLVETILAQLGVDADSVAWQEQAGKRTVTVTAWQLVDGRRTDLAWQVVVGPGPTVLRASGFAGTLRPTGVYPVVAPAIAIDRANDLAYAPFGPTPVRPADSDIAAPAPAPTTLAGLPVVIGALTTVTIVDAVPVLAQHRQPDGSLMLVPAYRLIGDDGGEWVVISVASRFLAVQPPNPTGPASTGPASTGPASTGPGATGLATPS